MPTLTSRTKSWKNWVRPEPEESQGRILGIDPGLSATGFGIIEPDGTIVTQGVITTSSEESLACRLLVLNEQIHRLIRRYRPACCAIETLFFKSRGARSVILSAQSRGAILAALAKNRVPVYELTPATIKLAVTGSGRASKSQLNYMIRKLLRTNHTLPEHAADALAVAWCLKSRIYR